MEFDEPMDCESAEMSSSTSSQIMGENTDYVVIAAIDFGTTFSGYAFCYKSAPEDIKLNKSWGAQLGHTHFKTPTSVLCNPDGSFHSFGYEAQRNYASLISEEEGEEGYQLYERFKMKLHHQQMFGKKLEVTSQAGMTKPAIDLFVMALQYLAEHLRANLLASSAGIPQVGDIMWVLTVPAIWSDSSKQFMRQAAYKAELIDSENSPKLRIALEPEAAAIFCIDLPCHFSQRSPGGRKVSTGSTHLILDCGGGTVDITAHRVEEDRSMKEIHVATGGAYGGNKVNDRFQDKISSIFGHDFIDSYKRKFPVAWHEFMLQFETKKCAINPDGGPDFSVTLHIPWSMGTEFEKFTDGKRIDVVANEWKSQGISFSNGMLCFRLNALNGIFQPVVNDIVDHLRDLMDSERLPKIDYIFLVGGFSQCQYIQRDVKKYFEKRATVIVPEESIFAIIKGAIMFGQNPGLVRSRVARRAYGFRASVPFIEKKHEEIKRMKMGKMDVCQDVFNLLVNKHETITSGQTKQYTGLRARKSLLATKQIIPMFSSNLEITEDVVYTDDPGINKLGEITFPAPENDVTITLELKFGGTEIRVRAVNADNGEEIGEGNTTINFLTD